MEFEFSAHKRSPVSSVSSHQRAAWAMAGRSRVYKSRLRGSNGPLASPLASPLFPAVACLVSARPTFFVRVPPGLIFSFFRAPFLFFFFFFLLPFCVYICQGAFSRMLFFVFIISLLSSTCSSCSTLLNNRGAGCVLRLPLQQVTQKSLKPETAVRCS